MSMRSQKCFLKTAVTIINNIYSNNLLNLINHFNDFELNEF